MIIFARTVELTVAIICGCLPPLAPLYTQFMTSQRIRSSVRQLLSLTFGTRSRSSPASSRDNHSTKAPKAEFPKEGFTRMTDGNSNVQLVNLDKGTTDTEILAGGTDSFEDHEGLGQAKRGIDVQTSINQQTTVRNGEMV